MIKQDKTSDPLEIARFAQHASQWWDKDGAFKTLHDINPARLMWIERYIKPSHMRVLDIGCGGGVLCEGLARLGAHVTGLDVEEKALAIARRHADSEGLLIDYVHASVDTFEAKLFDSVMCLEMLEHVDDPACIIKAASRLVKPGGYVFLSTVNRTLKAYATVILAAEYVLSLLPRQTHTFERFIRPSELASCVRHAGLDVIGMTGLVYHPFTRQVILNAQQVDVNYLLVAQRPE
jgi:2-polyprenyl-6-hydroxyphenyl methylase / 3-demethylubiquinone-9 3-methyltransferase